MTKRTTTTLGAALWTLLAMTPDVVGEEVPGDAEPAASGGRTDPVDARALGLFQAREDEPVHSFRARRRMHARALGKEALMEVLVELDPEGGFRFTILAETGSGALRSKVFRSMLEKETELRAGGGEDGTSLTTSNYEFRADGRESDGLVRLRAVPRRREAGLVDGCIVVTPDTADLVRIEGRLARSPSFWITRVELVRHFRRLREHRVVVRIESVAHVRFLGLARLTIDFTYEMIDGEWISPGPLDSAPVAGIRDDARDAEAAPRACGAPGRVRARRRPPACPPREGRRCRLRRRPG